MDEIIRFAFVDSEDFDDGKWVTSDAFLQLRLHTRASDGRLYLTKGKQYIWWFDERLSEMQSVLEKKRLEADEWATLDLM